MLKVTRATGESTPCPQPKTVKDFIGKVIYNDCLAWLLVFDGEKVRALSLGFYAGNRDIGFDITNPRNTQFISWLHGAPRQYGNSGGWLPDAMVQLPADPRYPTFFGYCVASEAELVWKP